MANAIVVSSNATRGGGASAGESFCEPITDGQGNLIFAAGDVITAMVVGEALNDFI
jgi:hypothetical protein